MENNYEEKHLLAIYDITGIQEYIFASSRLSENAGASLIVTRILKEQLKKVLEDVIEADKVAVAWKGSEDSSQMPNDGTGSWAAFEMLKNEELLAEIIYVGGGNAVVAYRKEEDYHRVNQAFAKVLIETSYTLTLATSYIKTNFIDYGADKKKLDMKLDQVKKKMLRQRPMGALPIVEQDPFNGLPVTGCFDKMELSTLQILKRTAYKETKKQAELIYGHSLPADAVFAVEMEDLIWQKGEDAYAAVVHIDGNGMGNAIRDQVRDFKCYDTAIPKMRELSARIANKYQDVFAKVVDEIYRRVQNTEKNQQLLCKKNEAGQFILPIRPIILDGDDVTFVCSGRLGVPLAAKFLRRLLQEMGDGSLSFSACAGVALVHSHFPFDIAYELAEFCCHNAKKVRLQENRTEGYLDFHLVRGAYVTEVQALRQEESSGGQYGKRPYLITKDEDFETERSFDRLHEMMNRLPGGSDSDEDRWPRLRLKKLYETYSLGEDAVRLLLKEFESRGFDVSNLVSQKLSGGFDEKGEAPLFDGLELMELYERSFFSDVSDLEKEGAK